MSTPAQRRSLVADARLGDPLTDTEQRLVVALADCVTVRAAAVAAGVTFEHAGYLLRRIKRKLGATRLELTEAARGIRNSGTRGGAGVDVSVGIDAQDDGAGDAN